jgi:hypothetical protein
MDSMHSLYRRCTNSISVSLTGESSSAMIRGQAHSCEIISRRLSAPCFRNSLLLHATNFMFTSDLRGLCAFVYFTTLYYYKSSIYAGFPTLSIAIKKSNMLHFLRNFSKFWWVKNGTCLIILEQTTSHDLISNSCMQQSEPHREMKF